MFSAQRLNLFLHTLHLRGFSAYAFPLVGKQPVCQWRPAPRGPIVIGSAEFWRATGYAIAPLNRRAVVLDIDDPDHPFSRTAMRVLPRRPSAFVVKSSKGYHHYLIAAYDAPAAVMPKQVMNLETGKVREIASLRSEGAYIVGPGSLHPSGVVYKLVTPGPAYPLVLTESETAALFALFSPDGGPSKVGEISPAKPPILHNGAALPKPTKNGPKNGPRRLNQRLLEEVFRRVEMWQGRPLVWRPSARGYTASLWRNFTREDKHRSSFISRETGMVHDRAGQRLTLPQVCTLLGIRMNDYGGLYE
jgi:hypothetical protein